MNDNEEFSNINISVTRLWKILHKLNFSWESINGKSMLIGRMEIVCWRRSYLNAIKAFWAEVKRIYYLDETWVNEGYTVLKVWQDKNITSSLNALLEGLSTGIKAPSGKSERLIITHIGSSDGFVEGGLLMFQSKKTGNYYEDMNENVFESCPRRFRYCHGQFKISLSSKSTTSHNCMEERKHSTMAH